MDNRHAEAEAAGENSVGAALDQLREVQSQHTEQARQEKVRIQPKLVSRYYEAVTRFYEFGWGTSFHYSPRAGGVSLRAAQRRQHEEIVSMLELKTGMVVGDIGCGIGGPMLDVAQISGAAVTGINISEHQIQRGRALLKKAGLEACCEILHADFLDQPFAASHFDAAYSIEAICHAPDKLRAFQEIFRTLKPGGKIAIFDEVLTDAYDHSNSGHAEIRKQLEFANAMPNLSTAKEQVENIRNAGFEILHAADYGATSDPSAAWYQSLEGRDFSLSSLARTPAGRVVTAHLTKFLEWLRLAPRGTSATADLLNQAADAYVAAGRLGIFTPCFLVHARKPEHA